MAIKVPLLYIWSSSKNSVLFDVPSAYVIVLKANMNIDSIKYEIINLSALRPSITHIWDQTINL